MTKSSKPSAKKVKPVKAWAIFWNDGMVLAAGHTKISTEYKAQVIVGVPFREIAKECSKTIRVLITPL